MRKKEVNPVAVVVLILVGIGALIISFLINNFVIPDTKWSSLFFWLIFLAIAVPGAFFTGKFLGKRKRGGRR